MFRGGRFEYAGGDNVITSGWGMQFAGILKLLQAMDVLPDDEGFASFLLHHVDIVYNHSMYSSTSGTDLFTNQQFDALNISISN